MRLGIVSVVALLALSPTALASDRFSDPRGDAGDGPDITAVTLSHTDATVRIAVDFGSAPPLGYSEAEGYTDMLLVGIHTDDDLRQVDVEYWTGVHGVDLTRAMVVRPEERAIVGYADVSVDGSTVVLDVERALLEDPSEIAVQIAAGREYADETAAGRGGGDYAPASGAHPYALSGGGGPAWLRPLVAAAVAGAALAALVVLIVRRRGPGTRDERGAAPV